MNRFIVPLLFLSLTLFSSCMHQPATDLSTDEALGLGAQSDTSEAELELAQLRETQREDQKSQLDRQIADSTSQNILH